MTFRHAPNCTSPESARPVTGSRGDRLLRCDHQAGGCGRFTVLRSAEPTQDSRPAAHDVLPLLDTAVAKGGPVDVDRHALAAVAERRGVPVAVRDEHGELRIIRTAADLNTTTRKATTP